MQQIQHTQFGTVRPVLHLVEYHAYRIEDGTGKKIINPEWTEDCGKLLDLKKVGERGHAAAVAYFSKKVKEALIRERVPPPNLRVHIVIVPSSTAGQWGDGLLKIGQNLLRHNGNFVDSMKALERTETIKKLALGGNRSVWTHERSIGLAQRSDRLQRKTILLLDDITTTGNSLLACAQILLHHCGAEAILPLALGKTV